MLFVFIERNYSWWASLKSLAILGFVLRVHSALHFLCFYSENVTHIITTLPTFERLKSAMSWLVMYSIMYWSHYGLHYISDYLRLDLYICYQSP